MIKLVLKVVVAILFASSVVGAIISSQMEARIIALHHKIRTSPAQQELTIKGIVYYADSGDYGYYEFGKYLAILCCIPMIILMIGVKRLD